MNGVTIIRIQKDNYKPCLDRSDIASVMQLADKMASCNSAEEVIKLAKNIVYCDERNDKARENETIIRNIYNYVKDNSDSGDTFNERDVFTQYMRSIGKNEYLTCGESTVKTRVALRRLCDEGYLRKVNAKTEEPQDGWHVVYIVK